MDEAKVIYLATQAITAIREESQAELAFRASMDKMEELRTERDKKTSDCNKAKSDLANYLTGLIRAETDPQVVIKG